MCGGVGAGHGLFPERPGFKSPLMCLDVKIKIKINKKIKNFFIE